MKKSFRNIITILKMSVLLAFSITSYTTMANDELIRIEPTPKDKVYPIQRTTAEWKNMLTAFEYNILIDKGTEYAFSGALDKEKRKGIYYSRATGQPLFSSEHKYDSGTGWPSFWRPIDAAAIDYYSDTKLFYVRTEVTDSSSGAHLGHVFKDGPRPTGLRYCINSASLIFVAEGEKPPKIVQEYLDKYGASSPIPKNS